MESPIHRDFLVFLGATDEPEFFDEATNGTSPFQSGATRLRRPHRWGCSGEREVCFFA